MTKLSTGEHEDYLDALTEIERLRAENTKLREALKDIYEESAAPHIRKMAEDAIKSWRTNL